MTAAQHPDSADHDPPGMIVFGDLDTALRREIEIVAERFPQTDAAAVAATVREVFTELRRDAEVEIHLLPLTRNQAIDRLRAQGHHFRSPTVTADSDDTEAGGSAVGDPAPDQRVVR